MGGRLVRVVCRLALAVAFVIVVIRMDLRTLRGCFAMMMLLMFAIAWSMVLIRLIRIARLVAAIMRLLWFLIMRRWFVVRSFMGELLSYCLWLLIAVYVLLW